MPPESAETGRDVLVLTGPTASGKSAVALDVAERLGAEIVSMDSMKVYRGMDIGTAKPTPEARKRVRHHLLDLRDPWETYTVRDFVRDAEAASRDILSRGRRVLFEGGTPLYLKAFVHGLLEGPEPDPALRERLRAEARERGTRILHGRLGRVDPKAASRIHPNDERRIVRALEVYEQTGVPLSDLQGQFARRRACVRARIVGLRRPRASLRARVARRVEAMLEAGWLDEVRALVSSGRELSPSAAGALGYRELAAHLRGETTIEAARERISRETVRFVRKQLTWLRSFGDLVWVDGSEDPARDARAVEAALLAHVRPSGADGADGLPGRHRTLGCP
jgi:tRNA dimethylallyltransferase